MPASASGAETASPPRRNNTDLKVANRDTWTVIAVADDGSLTVSSDLGERTLPAGYVREHVELAYATTIHRVQGDTATAAYAAIGAHSTAASSYVAMTRGRENNVAHLVADDLHDAREQWVAALERDRADLGPAHAADVAQQEAARYAEHRPLGQALADLHAAWTREQNSFERLVAAEQRRDLLINAVALTTERDTTVPGLEQNYYDAPLAALQAQTHLQRLEAVVSAHAEDLATILQREWDQQREPARHAARTIRQGTGRFGRGRAAVTDATDHLQHWAGRWQPYLPDMPTTTAGVVARAARFDNTPDVHDALHQHARHVAEHAHPDSATARTNVDASVRRRDQAWRTWRDTQTGLDLQLSTLGRLAHHPDPAGYLGDTQQTIGTTEAEFNVAQGRITALLAEPTVRCRQTGSPPNATSGRPTETPQPRTAAPALGNSTPTPARISTTFRLGTPLRTTHAASADDTQRPVKSRIDNRNH